MPPRFYSDDLAYIHDIGFGFFANGVAPGLIELLGRAADREPHMLELGCGSGLLTRHLVEAGWTVTGVDIAPAMIELAKAHVPSARFQVGSLWDTEFPGCDAITVLGEALCYRTGAPNEGDLEAFFQKCHHALPVDGLLIFDVVTTQFDRQSLVRSAEGQDWACLVRLEFPKDQPDRLYRHITSFRQVGELYRRGYERHEVQMLDPNTLVAQLTAAGFRSEISQTIGDFQLLPGRAAIIARRN